MTHQKLISSSPLWSYRFRMRIHPLTFTTCGPHRKTEGRWSENNQWYPVCLRKDTALTKPAGNGLTAGGRRAYGMLLRNCCCWNWTNAENSILQTAILIPVYGRIKRGKSEVGYSGFKKKNGLKRSIIVDGHGIPLSVTTTKANVHDLHSVIPTIDRIVVGKRVRRPKRLGADKGYDTQLFAGHYANAGLNQPLTIAINRTEDIRNRSGMIRKKPVTAGSVGESNNA